MAIEQIRYTWAKEGLNGLGKFQPVAASSGFLMGDASMRAVALRLCRYDRLTGSDDTLTSYGWIDEGPLRFAFCRTFLADDQVGHPGNFAAHVIVGSLEELPVRVLAFAATSSAWWRRPQPDETVGELRTLDSAALSHDFLPDTSWADDLAINILARILDGDPKIRVAAEPDRLLAAVGRIALRAPLLVEQRSFSTLERGETSAWFDIVGGEQPAEGQPRDVSEVSQIAAEFMLTSHLSKETLHVILGNDSRNATNLRRLAVILGAMKRLRAMQPVTIAELLPVLHVNAVLGDLLDYEAMRTLVAQALVDGHTEVYRALVDHATAVADDVWEEVGQRVGALLPTLIPERSLVQSLGDFPRRMLDGLTFALQRRMFLAADLSGLSRWPLELIHSALVSESTVGAMRTELLSAAAKTGSSNWLADEDIPAEERAGLLALFVDDGAQLPWAILVEIPELVSRLLADRPTTFSRLLRSMPEFEARSLLSSTLDMVQVGNRQPLPLALFETIALLVMRAPPEEAVALLQRVDICFLHQPDIDWDGLVEECTWRFIHAILASPTRRYPESLRALQLTMAFPRRSLARLVMAVTEGGKRSLRLGIAFEEFGPHSAVAASFVADAVLSAHPADPARLKLAVDYLRGYYGSVSAGVLETVLRAGLRAVSAYGYADTAVLVLRYAGDQVVVGNIPVAVFNGSRKPSEASALGRLAAAVFRSIVQCDVALADETVRYFRALGRPAHNWSKAMTAPPD